MSIAQPDNLDHLPPRHDVPRGGRSGFTVVDGRQVHYLEWGHAGLPAIVCLHGGGQSAYMFEELGAALGNRYHVLAPDFPDHGDSDPLEVEPTKRFALSRHALAGTVPPLCAQFGIDRAVLVGGSLGGLTSLTVGARWPELVAGMVIIDIAHRVEHAGVARIREFMGRHESFASLEDAATAIAEYLPNRKNVRVESLTRNLRQRSDGRWIWKHGLGRRSMAVQSGEIPSDVDALFSGVDDDAAGLQCPVLLLRGAHSDVTSDAAAREIAALIPDARLQQVRAAGHLTAGDNPESFVRLVSGFLDEIGW